MAAFLAKQMVGSQFSSVKAEISNETLTTEERFKMEEEERERLAMLQETEDIRKNKHQKMENERERMRQSVRQKYGIKSRQEEKQAELRKQQEAEMDQQIAAMNPASTASRGKSGSSLNSQDDRDFTTKLLHGNVSGAAIHVINKVQSFMPMFKQDSSR